MNKFVSQQQLEEIGKKTGFKIRKGIVTPESFLNTLFFSNAQNCPTLSDYCIDLKHSGSQTISKQAFDKRFNDRTKNMLTTILKDIMAAQIKRSKIGHSIFNEIRVMDSSEFHVSKTAAEIFPGYGGTGREAIVQIQLEYELLGGKVTELSIGSALDSDALAGMENLDKVPKKTLLIRDLGYFSPKAFKEINSRGIYFISRAKPQWSMYEKQDGEYKEITTQYIKDRLNGQEDKYLDMEVFVGSKLTVPVRLVANMLSEEQTGRRIKRKKEKRGPLSQQAEEAACLNLFVTNVKKEECCARLIYETYTLRWQIELIFKTWKSILRLHKIHQMNPTRLECILLIKLIWVMLNWTLLKLIEEATPYELSLSKFTRTMLSRSKLLDLRVMQDHEKFIDWIMDLCEISNKYHLKEYKKGTKKIAEILAYEAI